MHIYEESNRYLDFNTDSARLFAYKGIHLSEKKQFRFGTGDGYFYLALSYQLDNKVDSAVYYYKKCYRIYESVQAYKSCAISLSNLGDFLFNKGMTNEAYESYTESLRYFKKTGFKEGIARSQFNIGMIFKLNGNYSTASDYFFKALKLSESINDTIRTALTLEEIGNIYLRQKLYNKADNYYKKALRVIDKDTSDYHTFIKAGLKCNMAITNEKLNNSDKATEYYKKALTLYKNIDYKPGVANIFLNLGELYNKMERYDQALIYNNESLKIYKALNNPGGVAFAEYNRGSIYRGMKQYAAALQLFQKAFDAAQITGDRNLMKNITEEMSLAYESVKDYKNAFNSYKIFKSLSDSLYNDETTRKITSLELQYQFDKKQEAMEFAQQQKDLRYEANLSKQKLIVKVIIAFASLLVLLLFTGFGYYRNRQAARLHSLEIDLNHNIQQSLSHQMSPHFIFNCLNSIKALILDNKTEETEQYFGIFAGLMRKNLKYSMSPVIPVKNEIEALCQYVELEQLRFKNKLTFRIEVEKDIDQYACKIPSLLLQPFVENAIVHGLKEKEYGTIILEIKLSNNEILCSIDDDGIGRIKAKETGRKTGHTSYGTDLTEKRLELIYKLYGEARKLSVIDKYDQNGIATGTRVEFGIPIIV